MYSIVLMAAMSTGAAVPQWQDDAAGIRGSSFLNGSAQRHYRHGGHGCCGGYGGCYGGGYGCYGGGYGCYGGGGCRGYYGGYGGGCCGSYGYGYGGWGCSGGVPVRPMAPAAPPGGAPAGQPPPPPPVGGGEKPKEEVAAPIPATIVVSLPAEARLTIDDHITRSTSAVRTFVSPPLEPGKDFYYNLTAEVLRDNRPVTVSKRVTVRAGEEIRVMLDFSTAEVVQR